MPSPIADLLAQLHARLASVTDGQVASYIPELAKADPRAFGIAIATADGQLYEVGDTRVPFTIQSISKPLVYGVALEDRGLERVRRAVGVEPSGEAFNSISLEPETGRPMNPMINAGAIATASLVAGDTAAARLERVRGAISACAGRELEVDAAVFESERATGHRNRAIGHLLRNYDIVSDDPDRALELYFQQCALRIDCRDLALIGATLANGGRHPVTRVQAVRADFVGAILSVMTTCGVYDFTGEWIDRVGLPAKSGVGGGIVAVLPGQLGIGVFSPPLDARGNSVRGVQACEALSRELGLHFLQPPRAAVSTVRAAYTLAQVRSKRSRPAAEAALLAAQGEQVPVLELQGDLHFSTVEPVLRRLVDPTRPWLALVLDFKRVSHVDTASARLLAALARDAAAQGRQVVLTRVRRDGLLDALDLALDPRALPALSYQPQLDLGLEVCEQLLLRRQGLAPTPASLPALADHQLCQGLGLEQVALLEHALSRRSYEPGSRVIARGDPSDALYLLLRGQVSVEVELPGGGRKRLSTLTAGMHFGELGLVAGGTRSADVRADSPVECAVLDAATLQQLQTEHPALAIRLLHNLLLGTIGTVRRLTAEVTALES